MQAIKTFFSHTHHDQVPVHELDNIEELTKRVKDSSFEANATNEHDETPLHLLVKRPFTQDKLQVKMELIISMLTYSRADMNIPDNSGNSPLHSAVKAGELGTVKVLVAFNADVNQLNTDGETPLDLVTRLQTPVDSNLVTFLESSGAKHSDNLKASGFDFSKLECSAVESQDIIAEAVSRTAVDLRQKTQEILSNDQDNSNGRELASLVAKVDQLKKGGGRVLCLDGGGIRGLIQIEILSQLERETGKKVTELFDWIIGTSTGGVVAISVIYPKLTLYELRQFYFQARYEVFGTGKHGMAYNTDALIDIYRTNMAGYSMNDVKIPRILVSAVDKSSSNLKVRFFNNCFDDEYSTQEAWKVARYTSAAPILFKEMDDFVDGGVLAHNPSILGISRIQEHYSKRGEKLPISMIVSIGTGIPPDRELGNIDAQNYLSFGKKWFEGAVKETIGNLGTVLGNAIVDTQVAHISTSTVCAGFEVPYFRFDPPLSKVVSTGETDLNSLLDMMLVTKTTSGNWTQEVVEQLHKCVEARADFLESL